jgi:hypothetical protein
LACWPTHRENPGEFFLIKSRTQGVQKTKKNWQLLDFFTLLDLEIASSISTFFLDPEVLNQIPYRQRELLDFLTRLTVRQWVSTRIIHHGFSESD